MRSVAVLHFTFSLCLIFTGSAHGQLPQLGRDTIFLRQGDRLVGKLTGIDELNIRLQRLLPPLAGASIDAAPVFASITVLRAHVDRVEFSSDAAQERLLKNATAANLTEIETLWSKARPWLAIPKSLAGEIGLVYGDLLLRNGDSAALRKALELFRTIEMETWSRADEMRARQGRLRAMVAVGGIQEVISEAKELVRTSQDPSVLIEAKFILAKAVEGALRKFIEQNPRWEEDAFVRRERDRLYNESLELYLYPALFFGSETEVAARGLWGAVELCRFTGNLGQALQASRDLVEIYSSTSYARQAQDFMKTVPESLSKQYDETEAKR
jgi:hypothetical protein